MFSWALLCVQRCLRWSSRRLARYRRAHTTRCPGPARPMENRKLYVANHDPPPAPEQRSCRRAKNAGAGAWRAHGRRQPWSRAPGRAAHPAQSLWVRPDPVRPVRPRCKSLGCCRVERLAAPAPKPLPVGSGAAPAASDQRRIDAWPAPGAPLRLLLRAVPVFIPQTSEGALASCAKRVEPTPRPDLHKSSLLRSLNLTS